MPLTHNQINLFWSKPTYEHFKKSFFVKKIFESKDANDFIKTGAYLIKEAERLSNIIIPWDDSKRYEILKNPRLKNAFVSLGAEYLMKGIFLLNGYAINKPLPTFKGLSHPIHPIPLARNKRKLSPTEVQEMGYIVTHIDKLIDFTEFDNLQRQAENQEKAQLKGKRISSITRMTIPHPTSRQLLDYIHFKRNYSLHRPFIIPEFRGITTQLFSFLDYMTKKATQKTIRELASLSET